MGSLGMLTDQEHLRKFLIDFYATGLRNHQKRLQEAFDSRNWSLLKEEALNLELDSFKAGAVEMCGSLIQLRLHLEAIPLKPSAVEDSLTNIKEFAHRLMEFLRKYFEGRNIQIPDQENLQIARKKHGDQSEECLYQTYWCTIQ